MARLAVLAGRRGSEGSAGNVRLRGEPISGAAEIVRLFWRVRPAAGRGERAVGGRRRRREHRDRICGARRTGREVQVPEPDLRCAAGRWTPAAIEQVEAGWTLLAEL